MNRIREAAIVASSVAAMGVGVLEQAPNAEAQSFDANNIVCNGVRSIAQAERLASGAPDACGHRDVGKIWAAMGITKPLIAKMQLGEVCASDNLISSGRGPSPEPSEDTPVNFEGASFLERPLSVWGQVCYAAWKAHREDGSLVAILENCGNGEEEFQIPPREEKHPHPKKHHKQHHKKKPVVHTPSPSVVCSGPTTNGNSGIATQGGNCSTGTTTVIETTPPPVVVVVTPPNQPPQPPTQPPQESISISPLTTAEPLFTNSPEQLCVNAQFSPSNGAVPSVTFRVVSGEGSVGSTYQDADGIPGHDCAMFESGPDVQSSVVEADASGDNATPEATQFTLPTQQDSGFNTMRRQ